MGNEIVQIFEHNLINFKKSHFSNQYLFIEDYIRLELDHHFKTMKNAVFIDIGCGMSALAGTTSIERPYFGSWINYRLNNYNYSNMDPIDYNDNNGKNTIYI